MGGESSAALRRTVKLGDAWYPGNNNQEKPLDTPARLAGGIGELRTLAEKSGRDPKSIGIALIAQAPFEWKEHKVQDGSARRMFTGSSSQMADDAVALATVGVGDVALRLGGESLPESLERIERFGKDVIAKVAKAKP